MNKYFCDACGREMKATELGHFTYLCHIGDHTANGYSDSEGNPVSGREDSKEVCHKCYNLIMSAAYTKFEEIRKKNNNE